MRFPKAQGCAAKVDEYKSKLLFWRSTPQPQPQNVVAARGLLEEPQAAVMCTDGEVRTQALVALQPYDRATQMRVVGECRLNGKYPDPTAHKPTSGQIQRDLAQCYYWSGNFVIDYIWFVLQWHPLIGMLCSHPKHPWSKGERFCQFTLESLWTVFPTIAITSAAPDEASRKEMLLVFVTIPCSIISYFLYYLLILDIYFKDITLGPKLKKVNKGISWTLAKSATAIAHAFLCCCFCGACGFCLISLLVLAVRKVEGHEHQEDLPTISQNFLQSRVQCWEIWFIYMTLMPYVGFIHGWCIEWKAIKEGKEDSGFFELTADEGGLP